MIRPLNQPRTLCFFGTYESRFPRTITIKRAAERNGYRILECNCPFWELTREKDTYFSAKSIFQALVRLLAIYVRLALKYLFLEHHEAVIVGYNGYFDMPLAKLLAGMRKIPLIYTPVFPLYETLVEDRKYIDRNSLKSRIIHKVDKIACKLADLIIIETETYRKYYEQEFGLLREKFYKLALGADETNFFPRKEGKAQKDHLKVLFYGKFIPLQGIPHIIQAAKLLESEESVEFEVIGSGQLSAEVENLAKRLKVKNITFIPWVDYKNLPLHIQAADICLGIFGDTPKAQRGIPIKVYEALAMKKPVITGDTRAAREVFIHKENALLCKMANAEALAEAILLLKRDANLRMRLADEGHQLYLKFFSSERIAQDFKHAIEVFL